MPGRHRTYKLVLTIFCIHKILDGMTTLVRIISYFTFGIKQWYCNNPMTCLKSIDRSTLNVWNFGTSWRSRRRRSWRMEGWGKKNLQSWCHLSDGFKSDTTMKSTPVSSFVNHKFSSIATQTSLQREFLCWFAVFSSCNCLPAEAGSWMDLIEGHSGWVKWTMRRLKAVLLAIVIVMAVFIMSVLAFYNVFKKPLKSHEFSGGGHWHRLVDCLRLLFDPLENPSSQGLTSSSCGVAMGKGFWGSCFDNCTDTLCLFP